MASLKNCPFCNGNDVCLKYNGSKYGYYYYVECETCGSRTRGVCRPRRELPLAGEPDAEEWDNRAAETAALLWNRRDG